VVAIADIREGEEIMIDYGEEYWEVLNDWVDAQEEETE
jgi:SET domain-containing protein